MSYADRLEREWERIDSVMWDAHEAGEHAEPVKDCNRCWAAAKEAAGRPEDAEEPKQMAASEATTPDLALCYMLQTHLCYSYIRPNDLAFRVLRERLDNTRFTIATLDSTRSPDWFEDEEGFVRAPLSYENREGDPAFNGALDKW